MQTGCYIRYVDTTVVECKNAHFGARGPRFNSKVVNKMAYEIFLAGNI